VSRTGGGPASQSTRSSLGAQNGLPLFLAAFSRLLVVSVAMVEPTGILLLRVHGPRRCLPERRLNIGTAGCACLARRVATSSTTIYLLHHLRRTATVMARKEATADELEGRAEANGYQRGAHREEDSRRDAISNQRLRPAIRNPSQVGDNDPIKPESRLHVESAGVRCP